MDRITTRLVEARADPTGRLARPGDPAFVGRARELALLEAIYDECVSEPIARAVLVVAPAGMGKSRLLAELALRLASRTDAPEILIERSSSIGAGSSFAALAALIRRAASIGPEDDLDAARSKLVTRVARAVAPADAARVAEFLGEIAGVAFPAAPGSALQAARRDPALSGDQMRRAAEDWLAAECARRPLVLVFDDLHWGDTPDGAAHRLRAEGAVASAAHGAGPRPPRGAADVPRAVERARAHGGLARAASAEGGRAPRASAARRRCARTRLLPSTRSPRAATATRSCSTSSRARRLEDTRRRTRLEEGGPRPRSRSLRPRSNGSRGTHAASCGRRACSAEPFARRGSPS